MLAEKHWFDRMCDLWPQDSNRTTWTTRNGSLSTDLFFKYCTKNLGQVIFLTPVYCSGWSSVPTLAVASIDHQRTFAVSVFTFVAGGQRPLISHRLDAFPGLSVSLGLTEWHCRCFCPSSSTVLLIPSSVPLGHHRAIGAQWGHCFRCARSSRTPFCRSVNLIFGPFSSH